MSRPAICCPKCGKRPAPLPFWSEFTPCLNCGVPIQRSAEQFIRGWSWVLGLVGMFAGYIGWMAASQLQWGSYRTRLADPSEGILYAAAGALGGWTAARILGWSIAKARDLTPHKTLVASESRIPTFRARGRMRRA